MKKSKIKNNWKSAEKKAQSWHHSSDPFELIPIGYKSQRDQYTVIGFSSPVGKKIKNLRVNIKYDTKDKFPHAGETTATYLYVLYDYFNSLSFEEFASLFAREHMGRKNP